MEGVIVQSEHVYRSVPLFGAVVLVAVIAAVFICMFCSTIYELRKNVKGKWTTLVFTVIFACIGICVSYVAICGVQDTCRYLVVTIDDNVRFNEFNEHYEVVSKDGNLYTVRELPIEHVEAGDNE